jgi:hypothetical protein
VHFISKAVSLLFRNLISIVLWIGILSVVALFIMGGGFWGLVEFVATIGLVLAVPFALLFLALLWAAYKKSRPFEEEVGLEADPALEDIDEDWQQFSVDVVGRLGGPDFDSEAQVTSSVIEFTDGNGARVNVTKDNSHGSMQEKLVVAIETYNVRTAAGEHYGKDYKSNEEAANYYSTVFTEAIGDLALMHTDLSITIDGFQI